MKNEHCPITFEAISDIDPQRLFVHHDIGMDVDALYCYLLKAAYFLNPVTRTPFSIDELLALENQFKELHGPDSITSVLSTVCDAPLSPPSQGSEVTTEITVRLDPSTAENVVRLHVDLDMSLQESPPRPPRVEPCSTSSPDSVNQDFTFPVKSLVQEFLDAGRTARLEDRINTISFLSFEGTEVVHEMMALMGDDMWQQQVWEQTSSSVIDAISHLLQPDVQTEIVHNQPIEEYDLNLEVEYNDCWNVYRMLLLHVLEKRYTAICRRLYTIDAQECRLLFKIHLQLLQQSAPPEGLEILSTIIRATRTGIQASQAYHSEDPS